MTLFKWLRMSRSRPGTEKPTTPLSSPPSTEKPATLSDYDLGALTPADTRDAAGEATLPKWPRGWRPYANLVACWILMANSWGQVNAYGTFNSYYSQHLFVGVDMLLLNLIGATQCFGILLLSMPVGRLLDAGHAKTLVLLGTSLAFAGNFPVGFINGDRGPGEGKYALTWLFQGLLSGVGMSSFFVTSSQVAATWFPNRKAIVIGIVATGASCSGLFYPMMVKFIIVQHGFKIAMCAYSGLVAGSSFLASLILFTKNRGHTYRVPEKWSDLRVWIDVGAFKDRSFCWLTAGVCWMFLGFYAVFFNLEDWAAYNGFAYKDVPPGFEVHLAHEVHDDAIRTFWLLCTMNASSTIGRLSSSMLAQRFGALNIHFAGTALGSILIFSLWIPAKTLGPGLAFVIIYGAVSGAIIGLPPASVADVLSRHPEDQQAKLGQWIGMIYSMAALFALTGPIIAGHLESHYDSYVAVQIWSGTCLGFAAACFWMASRYARS